jgi:hypothetical protein
MSSLDSSILPINLPDDPEELALMLNTQLRFDPQPDMITPMRAKLAHLLAAPPSQISNLKSSVPPPPAP